MNLTNNFYVCICDIIKVKFLISVFLEFSSKKHVKDALLMLFLKVLILNSSAIVRIYSKILQTSSELIQTRSELISTRSELILTSSELILTIAEQIFTMPASKLKLTAN